MSAGEIAVRRSVRGASVACALALCLGSCGAEPEGGGPPPSAQRPSPEIVTTNLYTVVLERLQGPFAEWYGAIAAHEDGLLVSTRLGQLYFVTPQREIRELPHRIPLNWNEFNLARPELNKPSRFSVKGLRAVRRDGGITLLASHHHWNVEERCYALRLSRARLAASELLRADAPAASWDTLFEAVPCLPLPGHFVAHQAGGRIAELDGDRILLTVGDEGYDGVAGRANLPQDPSASHGKTIEIDLATGAHEIFTLGHRNQQGLYVSRRGEIWSTDHGPRGGDELNLLVKGRNYGWPHVTYGTDYGAFSWPLAERQGRHRGYERPVFAWVPSVATSGLVGVEKNRFPHWRGDLLVASLHGRLFRTRVREGRVVLVEPIEIGERLRDIVELADGTLVMKADEAGLIFMRPASPASGPAPSPEPEPWR